MNSCLLKRLQRGLLLVLLLSSSLSLAEEMAGNSLLPVSSAIESSTAHNRSQSIRHVGNYSALGKFSPDSTHSRWYNQALTETARRQSTRPGAVPKSINLHPLEHVVENYAPPLRASKPIKGQSKLGSWRDNLITLVYGREEALVAPRHLATDSKGRLIVCDPSANAIHVLDGEASFRIAAGPGRRLQMPAGIAVDANDNIYVADPMKGTLQVYDPQGRFVREFGIVGKDESLFQRPSRVALDEIGARMYLLDPPRNLVYMLDEQGTILKRIGRSGVEFDHPTEMIVRNDEIIVLDNFASRIQVLDLEGNLLRSFNTRLNLGRDSKFELGLEVDNDGQIYLSSIVGSSVRIYSRDGTLLYKIGQRGSRNGEFNSPAGLWIDGNNQLFVSDTMNRRVQVFLIDTVEPRSMQAAGF